MKKSIAEKLAEAKQFFKEQHDMDMSYVTDNETYMEVMLVIDEKTMLHYKKEKTKSKYSGLPHLDAPELGLRKDFFDRVISVAEDIQ